MNILKSKICLVFGLVGLLIFIGGACSSSEHGIHEIQPLIKSININMEKENETHKETYIKVRYYGDDLPLNYLQFISNNPECAKIEYISHNPSSSYTDVRIRVIGVSQGETTCYVQTSDGKEKSDEISVKVTGDPNVIKIRNMAGIPISEAIAKTNEFGYTASFTHAASNLDFTKEIKVYSEDELKKWVIVDVKKVDSESKTVQFTINTSENIEKEAKEQEMKNILSEKISSAHAFQAVEDYGENEYPYGFTLHYIMGERSATAIDENTWFIKCEATIVNEYNAKRSAICEANVSGTKEAPQVSNFKIY